MNLGFLSFFYGSFDYVRMRFFFYFVEEKCVCDSLAFTFVSDLFRPHEHTSFSPERMNTFIAFTHIHTHPLTSAISIGSMVMRWNHLDFIYDCCCLSPIDELTSWWPLGHDSQSRNSFGLENVHFVVFFRRPRACLRLFLRMFPMCTSTSGSSFTSREKNEKKANVVDSDVHVVNASISVFVLLPFNVSLFTFQFIAHHQTN